MYHTQSAADILQSKANCATVQFIEISLYNTPAIVVDAKVKLITMHILCKVNKTCATMFKNIIDELLHNAEDHEFFFCFQSVLVFMEAAAGVDGAGATYFLEEVVDG